jgi:hypothetical protein
MGLIPNFLIGPFPLLRGHAARDGQFDCTRKAANTSRSSLRLIKGRTHLVGTGTIRSLGRCLSSGEVVPLQAPMLRAVLLHYPIHPLR